MLLLPLPAPLNCTTLRLSRPRIPLLPRPLDVNFTRVSPPHSPRRSPCRRCRRNQHKTPRLERALGSRTWLKEKESENLEYMLAFTIVLRTTAFSVPSTPTRVMTPSGHLVKAARHPCQFGVAIATASLARLVAAAILGDQVASVLRPVSHVRSESML